jgi:hypothetical protein
MGGGALRPAVTAKTASDCMATISGGIWRWAGRGETVGTCGAETGGKGGCALTSEGVIGVNMDAMRSMETPFPIIFPALILYWNLLGLLEIMKGIWLQGHTYAMLLSWLCHFAQGPGG